MDSKKQKAKAKHRRITSTQTAYTKQNARRTAQWLGPERENKSREHVIWDEESCRSNSSGLVLYINIYTIGWYIGWYQRTLAAQHNRKTLRVVSLATGTDVYGAKKTPHAGSRHMQKTQQKQ